MTAEFNLARDAAGWLESGPPAYAELAMRGFDGSLSRFDPGVCGAHWEHRRTYVETFGFSIPCREAVEAVARLSPLVELGAGTGYWSALLARAGADVVATDRRSSGWSRYGFRAGAYRTVRPFTARQAIATCPDRNVFVSWPCYDKPWLYNALRTLAPGRSVAIIGEGPGGCTGTISLFELLDEEFELVDDLPIPRWFGLNDRLTIHRRLVPA